MSTPKVELYREGVSTEPKCILSWCNLEAVCIKAFCRYHWQKLTPLARSVLKMSTRAVKMGRGFENLESNLKAAESFLIKEHITLVPCYRCRGKKFNTGHTQYLRGKPCSWCNKDGLVPKIM